MHLDKKMHLDSKNVGNQTTLNPIDFHYMDTETFLRVSSFVFHRRKSHKQALNDMKVKKW